MTTWEEIDALRRRSIYEYWFLHRRTSDEEWTTADHWWALEDIGWLLESLEGGRRADP